MIHFLDFACVSLTEKHRCCSTVEPGAKLPANVPALNTATFKVFAPALYKDYPDAQVGITAAITAPPTVDFSAGKSLVKAETSFDFFVQDGGKKVDAFTLTCGPSLLGLEATVTVDAQQTFHISFGYDGCALTKASAEPWVVSGGDVHAPLMGALVNSVVSYVLVPLANAVVKDGGSLPPGLFGPLELTNSDVVVDQETFLFATDLKKVGR